MSPALAQIKFYNEDDYYNLPDDTKAELIDGNTCSFLHCN